MVRFAARWFLLIFPAFYASGALAQTASTHVEPASNRAARTSPVAPLPQQLFGAIPLSTKSEEARKSLELAWDKYENAMYEPSANLARQATNNDSQSALSYAMVSFAARRGMPDASALAKAKALLPRATPDEQLLVRWMTAIQDRNLLPAIASMNDLLKRYPRDKHVLYVTGEWLFLQQDNDRARTLLETALQVDPNFPAALNRLGYLYLDSSNPDRAKAIASLKRYAEIEPSSPNPQDSLGEVLREAGEDQGSLEHYRAALQIDHAYISSQYAGQHAYADGRFRGRSPGIRRRRPHGAESNGRALHQISESACLLLGGKALGRTQRVGRACQGSCRKEGAEFTASNRVGAGHARRRSAVRTRAAQISFRFSCQAARGHE